MGILREPIVNDNSVNYVATLAFFCAVSCVILMLRFGGFKANFNLVTGKRVKSDYYDDIPTISSAPGAYKARRDEFYRKGSILGPPKKLDPSMVKLPPSSKNISQTVNKPTSSKTKENLSQAINQAVLSPNLALSTPNVNINPALKAQETNKPKDSIAVANQGNAINANLTQSTPNISTIHKDNFVPQAPQNKPKGPVTNQGNTQALDKKALAAQKKAEKLAAQERSKQEKKRKELEAKQAKERKQQEAQQEKQRKLEEKKRKDMAAKQEKERKVREKLEAQQAKKNKGKVVNNPLAQHRRNPMAQGSQQATTSANTIPKPPPLPKSAPPITNQTQNPQYSSNTLDSSISKASGPPAYSEINSVQNKNDNSGNTSFGKPIEEPSTWDLVSQHRQEINRPPVSGGTRKQTVIDTEYTARTGRKSLYV